MPAPDGTLFPGMDGTPGEIPESVDITGQVLPLLSSDPVPIADGEDYGLSHASADVSVLPQVPTYDVPGQPAPNQDYAVIDATPRQPQPAPTRRSLDERIALLTGAYAQQERPVDQYLNQLTQALINQGKQIESLAQTRRTPAPASTPTGEVDPITGQAAEAPAPAPVSAGDIEAVVTRAIQNYDSQLSEQRLAAQQLQLAQEDAYLRAAQEVPGLDDPNSQVHKTFVKVWARSPLRERADGPIHVALQVQGLLASEAASNAALTQRKRQAGVSTPAPTATDELGTAQTQQLQQEYARLTAAIRSGNKDPDLMLKFRKIGRVLGRTKLRR